MRVVWIGKNATPFFELLFGAAAIRAAVAPLNLRLPPAELIDLVDDAGAVWSCSGRSSRACGTS